MHKKGKPLRFGGEMGKKKEIWTHKEKLFKIQHLGRKRFKIMKLVGEKRAKDTKLERGKE